jgi:hypothetical protein
MYESLNLIATCILIIGWVFKKDILTQVPFSLVPVLVVVVKQLELQAQVQQKKKVSLAAPVGGYQSIV